jgi:hypothetical protein
MTEKARQKPTLDRPTAYQISVPGVMDERWSDWYERMTVSVRSDDYGLPITTFTVTVDQAALQGLLRRLYSLGIPLISVNCLDVS